MTFAEAHKKLIKKNAPTAEIDRLAKIQEQVSGRVKEDKDGIRYRETDKKKSQQIPQQMNYGGKRKKQMAFGGFGDPPPPFNDIFSENPWLEQTMSNYNPSVTAASPQQLSTPSINEMASLYEPRSISKQPSTFDNILSTTKDIGKTVGGGVLGGLGAAGEFIGDNATLIGSLLPGAVNTYRGVFGDSDVPDVPYNPPSGRAEDTIRQMETDVDVEPQLAAIDKNLRSILADPNASMNDKRAASAMASQQKSQVLSQAENKETGLYNQQQSMLANAQARRDQMISQGRNRAAQMERQQQMRADARQNQLLQTGLGQIASTLQRRKMTEDQMENDLMKYELMVSSMPPSRSKNKMIRRLIERYPELKDRLSPYLIPEDQLPSIEEVT